MQTDGFRRALERLHLDQADKHSVTLRANYEPIIKQLEDELRQYDDANPGS